jgi:hypothetical protein
MAVKKHWVIYGHPEQKDQMAHKAGNHCSVEARMTYLLLKTFKLLLVFGHFSF